MEEVVIGAEDGQTKSDLFTFEVPVQVIDLLTCSFSLIDRYQLSRLILIYLYFLFTLW